MDAPCKLCDGEATAPAPLPASVTRDHDLRQCQRCGFVFLAGEQKSLHGRPDGAAGNPASFPRRVLSSIRFTALHRWLQRLHGKPRGRILDVGSGLADLALFLTARGWEVWGCDPAPDAAPPCRSVIGDHFVAASLDTADLPEASFDVVLLNFSLEHMADPRSALVRVRDLLRPGGVAAIRVPNIDAALAGRAGASFQLQLDHHRSFFGPGTLTRLLEGSDLRILEVATKLSLIEGVSIACELVPSLDPEIWIHRPASPRSVVLAAILAALTCFVLPLAWHRCRRGQGVVLHAAAKRPAAA